MWCTILVHLCLHLCLQFKFRRITFVSQQQNCSWISTTELCFGDSLQKTEPRIIPVLFCLLGTSKKLHRNEVLCLSWRCRSLSCTLVTRGNSFQIPRYPRNVYKGWPLKLRIVFLWFSSPTHRPHWSQRCSKNSPLHSANQLSNNCVLHECMHLYLLQHICTHADCCAIAGYRAVPFALC